MSNKFLSYTNIWFDDKFDLYLFDFFAVIERKEKYIYIYINRIEEPKIFETCTITEIIERNDNYVSNGKGKLKSEKFRRVCELKTKKR